jgi:transcriptional regulator with XRE-family HTH domain
MARAATRWGVRDLAARAKVSFQTVTRFENGQAEPHAATLQAIRHAFENAGVEFLPSGGVQLCEQPAEAKAS